MSLKLNTASGGSITLQEADTASNLTITVPAVTGTMLTNKTAGTVLQVVNTQTAINTQTNSASYVDTGVSASITPTSATSKILVIVSMAGIYKNTADIFGLMQLLRGSTLLAKMEGAYGYNGTGAENNVGAASISYLDTPATTSSLTYKTQICCNTGGLGNVGIGRNDSTSSITLMEIAA